MTSLSLEEFTQDSRYGSNLSSWPLDQEKEDTRCGACTLLAGESKAAAASVPHELWSWVQKWKLEPKRRWRCPPNMSRTPWRSTASDAFLFLGLAKGAAACWYFGTGIRIPWFHSSQKAWGNDKGTPGSVSGVIHSMNKNSYHICSMFVEERQIRKP